MTPKGWTKITFQTLKPIQLEDGEINIFEICVLNEEVADTIKSLEADEDCIIVSIE